MVSRVGSGLASRRSMTFLPEKKEVSQAKEVGNEDLEAVEQAVYLLGCIGNRV